jgi:argininosuccinate lyase
MACIEMAIPIVRESEMQVASIAARMDLGYLDATALMEALIQRGVPQRTAHHQVGALVAIAKKRGVPLVQLTDAEFHEVDPRFDPALRSSLSIQGAVASYRSAGSSHPEHVAQQIHRWKTHLEK